MGKAGADTHTVTSCLTQSPQPLARQPGSPAAWDRCFPGTHPSEQTLSFLHLIASVPQALPKALPTWDPETDLRADMAFQGRPVLRQHKIFRLSVGRQECRNLYTLTMGTLIQKTAAVKSLSLFPMEMGCQ